MMCPPNRVSCDYYLRHIVKVDMVTFKIIAEYPFMNSILNTYVVCEWKDEFFNFIYFFTRQFLSKTLGCTQNYHGK